MSTLKITIPRELDQLCRRYNTDASTVIRGFIADLCGLHSPPTNPRPDGYTSNGSDERSLAREYFERCGYTWTKD